MKKLSRRLVFFLALALTGRMAVAESLSDAAGRAGLAVESQAQGADTGIVIGVDPVSHERSVVVFRQAEGGIWRIDHRDLICGQSASAARAVSSSPAAAPPAAAPFDLASVEAALQARSQSTALSIPAGRSLSDGTVRTVRADLRSWLRRLQTASSPGDGYASIQVAFEALISDIGWIDVRRFGVPAACDAASIVALSGNRRLMEGALPIMERSLKNAEGGEACYSRALEAYQTLLRRN